MLFDDQIYLSTFFAYGHRFCAKPNSTQWVKLDSSEYQWYSYSTLCRRQKKIDIAISYQKSHEGLHLLIDSTGLKFLGDKLSAMSFDSQVNEVHARVTVLNKYTELGRLHTQVVT